MRALRSRVIHTDNGSSELNTSEQILQHRNIVSSKTKRRKDKLNKPVSKKVYDVSIDDKFQLNENDIFSMEQTLLNKEIHVKISDKSESKSMASTSKPLGRSMKNNKSMSNIVPLTGIKSSNPKQSYIVNSFKDSSNIEKTNHKNYIPQSVHVDSDSKIITGIKYEGLSRKLTPISYKQYKNNSLSSVVMDRKNKNDRKSNLDESYNSQDHSPTFKNIVTSTTIKPKKFKASKKNGTKRSSKSKITSKDSIKIDNSLEKSNIIHETNEINCSNNNSILLKNDDSNIFFTETNLSSTNKMCVTDVLNSTYIKIENDTNVEVSKNPNELSVLTTNNSGQWKVEDQNSIINISDDVEMNELNSNNTTEINNDAKKVFFLDHLSKSPPKSARKKWQRLARNSQGANSLLEQISTPHKNSSSQLLNIPANVMHGDQSTNKKTGSIKRTKMPNFALIHQKAYEKMESIVEYSQRKKDRVNLLSTNKKVESNENKPIDKDTKLKSSRQLFTNQDKTESKKAKFNRFGFKSKAVSSHLPSSSLQKSSQPSNQYIVQVKPSIYAKNEVLAIANKNVQNTGKLRENKRDILKGVRTNRRFELLMKMRNN